MHPSFINNNGDNSFSAVINPQRMTSFCYYSHEDPHFKLANDGKFVPADCVNGFNSPVILENLESKCLKGKRSSKKDRHSKINTARGPRDRRMRLSLEVAKKFFSLQDMLGFDKASSTIDWLLMKSKPSIRDLHLQQMNQSCSIMGVSNSPSSGSECEVLSGSIDEQSMEKTRDDDGDGDDDDDDDEDDDDHDDDKVIVKDESKFKSCSRKKEKKKVEKRVRKSVCFDQSLAKETREKARARARKRTNEKRSMKLGYDHGYGAGCHQYSKFRPSLDQMIMDQNANRLGSWIPFGENQVQLTDQNEYPNSHFQFNSSMMSSSSFLFNYQHNHGLSHEHQFNDLQILGKPWEGFNN